MARLPRRRSLAVWFIEVLLCAMIPLLLIYFAAFSANIRMLREEITSSLWRQNKEFSDRLQDDMTRIINTNYMLAQNWELGKLSVIPDEFSAYEKAMAFQNIQDKIYLAQLNSRFIQDISVYFPGLDKCLSTNSSSSNLSEMRTITAKLNELPQDQFFLYNDTMILVSENTFSSESPQPNLVIKTTLSQRELLAFFRSFYWNQLSSGAVTSLRSASWPESMAPGSVEAAFHEIIRQRLDMNREAVQEEQLLVEHHQSTYQLIYSYIPYADLLLMRYFDIDQVEQSVGMNRMMLVFFAAVVGLAFLLIYYALYRLVNRPLNRLTTAFMQVEQGNLDVELRAETRGEFAYVFQGFSHMLSRLKVLIEQTYLQGQMVKKSEFKQLQAQIDPHFLYNGFFILNKRIRANDKEGALAFSKLLSDYFRYVTQNARDAVPLQEEVAHVYNYAHIQQVRFSNRLTLTLDPVPEEYAHLLIPRLVLQPIVENVFKHVLDYVEGTTALRISYQGLAEGLELWIEDSGTSMTDEKLEVMRRALTHTQDEQEISGLTNVHMRLQLFCGEGYGLFYDRSAMGGLRVRLRIPYRKEAMV